MAPTILETLVRFDHSDAQRELCAEEGAWPLGRSSLWATCLDANFVVDLSVAAWPPVATSL